MNVILNVLASLYKNQQMGSLAMNRPGCAFVDNKWKQ